jgi:hypothetical protein
MPQGHGRGDVLFAPAVDGTHRQLQSKCDGRSYWLLLTLTLFKLSIGIRRCHKGLLSFNQLKTGGVLNPPIKIICLDTVTLWLQQLAPKPVKLLRS